MTQILSYINRPSLYMSICIVLWGLFSTLTGIVNSAGPLLGLRTDLLCCSVTAKHSSPSPRISRWSARSGKPARFIATSVKLMHLVQAFYCGAMFMLSKWFTKSELAFRGALCECSCSNSPLERPFARTCALLSLVSPVHRPSPLLD